MVQIITKQVVKTINQKFYKCEECGFEYRRKEWAEKCEAWCKEHHSCNIEITAHAVKPAEIKPTVTAEPFTIKYKKSLSALFYGLIGVFASLVLFLVFYMSLRLNASIDNLIRNFLGVPWYFWPYVILTVGTIMLFGLNASLFAYRMRKYGFPNLRKSSNSQAGTGLGALIGIAASACPVCGSTILAAIGITGGLAAFPLAGLELKALSFGLMILPIWLLKKDLKKLDCNEDGTCPAPRDTSFQEKDRPWLTGLLILTVFLGYVSWGFLKTDPAVARLLTRQDILNPNDNQFFAANSSQTGNKLFYETTEKVLQDFQSKIYLGDAVVKLVEKGVIDKERFQKIYERRGGLPQEFQTVLDKPSDRPILLTKDNANYYVNFLWALGLANYMSTNKQSPISGSKLFNFASTGGWTLGREDNGGKYFNKFKIVELTSEQEVLVTKIAQNTYRPCCNNSTFFQDCNHGSALLGLLQLGASQGLTEEELYREALVFNSHWFTHSYIQTALYFRVVKNTDWNKVDPQVVMGKDYSSISGWSTKVSKEVQRLNLVPQKTGSGGCGV